MLINALTLVLFFPFQLISRLEEKFSDMETENQVLRQQALLHTPVKKTSERPPIPATQVNILCKNYVDPLSLSLTHS